MKTICIAIQKGGTGKTTTVSQLAAGLYAKGHKVLCVDLDAQANLTGLYDLPGWNPEDSTHSIYGVLHGKCDIKDAIYPVQIGWDIVPAVLDLSAMDMELSATGREYRLQRALKPLSDKYDVCLLDTPPALGIMTVNALTAADTVIVPVCPDAFALSGLNQLNRTIQTVKEFCNPTLKIGGVLLTRVDRTNLTESIREVMQEAAKTLGTELYKQDIRQAVAIRESQFFGTNLLEQATQAAEDYRRFVDEVERTEAL